MFKFLSTFVDETEYFLSTVTVASCLPGRIRCYSSLIKRNDENASRIKTYFSKYSEINRLTVNKVTGSVLIEYDIEKLSKNKELKKLEQLLKDKFKK